MHPVSCTTPACSAVPVRCSTAKPTAPAPCSTSTTRRTWLATVTTCTGLAALLPPPPATASVATDNPPASSPQQPPAPPSATPPVRFSADDFVFDIPPGFTALDDAPDPSSARPRSTLDGEVQKPIRARFVSPDGRSVITVLARDAALVRPTFVQLNDIAQYGDLQEVANLLLPRGSRVVGAVRKTVQRPPRDTGTIRGVVTPPPETVYRYEVLLNNGLHVSVAVAAVKGKVYLMGASAPNEQWREAGPLLVAAADSFQLDPKYNVIY